MKRIILSLFVVFMLGTVSKITAQMTAKDPVYIETIANSSKTTEFILGIYPRTYKWSESLEASQLTMRILNKAKSDYKWEDYKVYVLLKDNSLFYNYKTKAESGDYACKYTIKGDGGFNDQVLCFDKKFDVKDIKSIWVSFGDATFIELIYSPAE